LRLVALLYPTSDLNHIITTPALILISMVLSKGHFREMKDVVAGIYFLHVTYDYVKSAKRYLPEVTSFLAKLIFLCAPVKTDISRLPASLLNLRKEEKNLLVLQNEMKEKPCSINLSESLSSHADVANMKSDVFKYSCIRNLFQLTRLFCKLHSEMASFNEIFSPSLHLMERIPKEKFEATVLELFDEVKLLMKSQKDEQKIPLTMQSRKPKPLPLLEPQFDEHYEVRSKRKAGDKSQNEAKKLKYKLKKETKGAIREIRKDSHFLAKEQLKERIHKDNVRKTKVKELHRQIENERREIKEM